MADGKSESSYLDQETYDNLNEIGATAEQKKSANESAKQNIDKRLIRYKLKSATSIDYDTFDTYGVFKLRVAVVGETGSGKSATANTLLGEKKFEESSSAVSMTTEEKENFVKLEDPKEFELSVLDTPYSWNAKIKSNKNVKVACYIFVINLASPRFTEATRTQLKKLKGANKKTIFNSGRCFVVLSHADSALQEKGLDDYLTEIKGDPLHKFLVEDMQGNMLAVNNTAGVKYEREESQKGIVKALFACMEKKWKKKKHHGACRSSKVRDMSGSEGKGNGKKKTKDIRKRTRKEKFV